MTDVDRSERQSRLAEFRAKLEKWHDDDKAASIAYERWTLATLVLLNGAAIIALLGVSGLAYDDTKRAIVTLLGGVVAAVLSGQVFADHYYHIGHSQYVTDDETEVEVNWNRLHRARSSWLAAKGLIFVSLGCFVAACLMSVANLEPRPVRDASTAARTK